MSKLTLEEAISHCLEVAEQNEAKAQKIGVQFLGTTKDREATECQECATDHRQLAEWLTELKEWKENPFLQIRTECRKNYYCNNCTFINHCPFAKWLTELREAKRLLKAAVEDIHELLCGKKNLDGNGQSCNICSYIEWCPCCKECTIREDLRNWRYADEALKLLDDEK